MRQHESLRLRRERDVSSLFGGRVTGVAGALALFLAERCLVNQEVRFLCGIHRRGTGSSVTGERVEPATTYVLLQDVAQRGPAAVFSRERADLVPISFHGTGYRIPGLHFDDLHRERYALDAELHRGGQHLLRTLGTVQEQGLRPPLQSERSDQSDDSEEMIGMKVGEEDFGQRKAHPVAHHLALGAFAAFEEERLAFAMNGEATDVPFDGWPGGGGAEEGDG